MIEIISSSISFLFIAYFIQQHYSKILVIITIIL